MQPYEAMGLALDQARIAYAAGEIPIGAVILRDGELLAAAHNQNRAAANPVRHAEIIAIEEAARVLGNERLTGCDLYVTKEPCAMCAGAIVHARLRRVVIAAPDVRYGACGTALSVCGNSRLNHLPEIEFGFREAEAAGLLRDFFRERRRGSEGSPDQVLGDE